MIKSLIIKLGMLTVTIAVVFWIGWAVPVQNDRSVVASAGDSKQTVAPTDSAAASSSSTASLTSSPKPAVRGRPQRSPGKLDLNRATAADLESLPGVGAVLAGRILEYRQTVGGFQTVEQLRLVKGIGAKKFDRVRALLEVTPVKKSEGKDRKTT